jgi:hypothetical protein
MPTPAEREANIRQYRKQHDASLDGLFKQAEQRLLNRKKQEDLDPTLLPNQRSKIGRCEEVRNISSLTLS